jgi:hypothetical protein
MSSRHKVDLGENAKAMAFPEDNFFEVSSSEEIISFLTSAHLMEEYQLVLRY